MRRLCDLRLADGRELIDGMASWWCAIHGYRHPVLDDAVRAQLERMAHVMFGGLTHEPAIRLAARLVELAPEPLDHVFFSDSGSVAVEVAIKMALQYWRARGSPERCRLLTVRGGYHGDTFGAMAVCDPVGGMHSLFTGALAEHVFADRPPAGFDMPFDDGYAAHVTGLVERHAHELAGVIVEPVVQGAGGMHFYSPEIVRLLRELCDRHELLLILDEIATGFGRTGALFASDHAGVSAGRDVRRQGAQRRLSAVGGDAVHTAGRGGDLAGRRWRADARPDVHGQRAWRAASRWRASTCSPTGRGNPRSRGSSAA